MRFLDKKHIISKINLLPVAMLITFDPCKIYIRYSICYFWTCELKLSGHACKIFFNYSKLCVISFFTKKVQFLPPKHASCCFFNEFSQRYWQESFNDNSFASQSRFNTYAPIGCYLYFQDKRAQYFELKS